MLSRRIPKPALSFTKMPSSSGPRCRIAWHMRCNCGRFNSLIGSRGYDSRHFTAYALPLYAYLATCFFPDSSCFARRISNRVPQRVKPQQLPHVTR